MKDRRSKKIKNLRKGGVRGFLFGNPIIPAPEFHYESSPHGVKISLKGYDYESVKDFAQTITQQTDDEYSQRNRFSCRNSGAIREQRRNFRRETVHDRPNSSRAYRQRLTSSQIIFERNFQNIHEQQSNTLDEDRLY